LTSNKTKKGGYMKLSRNFHNFDEYLKYHSANYSEYCFGGADLQANESIRMFIFSDVPCVVKEEGFISFPNEGVYTRGVYLSDPLRVEKTALRVSENRRPQFFLHWSGHTGGTHKEKAFAVLLFERDEVLSTSLNMQRDSARNAFYIMTSKN
jgi:hypothetical protein